MPRRLSIGCWLALAVACASLLSAQDDKKTKKEEAAQRVVQGTVFDADEKPVSGAVVRLKDVKGIKSFITRPDGSYHFSGLRRDSDYELQADYNGMSSGWKRLSLFDERKIAIINLKLEKVEKKAQ
jgi:hypothetical protein